ncbi:PC4 domain-containing protein [Trichonephila clavipes]|uniref:PC4 domain-containing protein n=1 Tax=Trichonephila clavipes TaxID=2585209 RepID=A0A8X7BL20_TRICX|nr:PC4 domain-containing protein [Trichonephila clavipes]
MKHATFLAFSHPRAKRVCFDKDNGKASFKPDAVPENHFHLGSHNYAVVSDFADVARIHLRRYKARCHWISFTYQRWNHCNTFRMVSPRKRIFCNRSSL